jgi:hypothetical protein
MTFLRMLALVTIGTLWATVSWSQNIPGAQAVIRSMLDESFTTIIASVPNPSVAVTVADHPDRRWFEAEFFTALNASGKEIVTTQAPATIHLVPVDVSTQYRAVESADSIQRVITVSLSAVLEHDGRMQPLDVAPLADTIVCLRTDAVAAESSQHTATRGEMPLPERSVWDDVLEPAIFVVAAVATVVLLFTVRSQ